MGAPPNTRTAGSQDDSGGFFLIVTLAGMAILATVLWINFHGRISGAVIALFHAEIGLLSHLTHRFDVADRQMMRAYPDTVRLRDLYGIAHDVGAAVRIPAAALMLVLAALCMVRAAPSRFKRALDIDGLIAEQARSFPATAAFVRRRLGLVAPSPAPRPADFALTPEEWLAAHATRHDGAVNKAAARRALAAQLGPRWLGVEEAAAPVRAMFAAFALHLAGRRADAQDLLGTLSAALARPDQDPARGPGQPLVLPKPAVARVDAILRDPAIRTQADAVAAAHAYTHPALMSLLNVSRMQSGVMAPGQFAWLKLMDRPLWYALQSLGYEAEGFGRYLHPNPRVEAAGARDHWAAERQAGYPIASPEIDRALAALLSVAAPAS